MTYTGGWLPSRNSTELSEQWKLLMVLPISIYGALLLIAGSAGNFGLAVVLLRDRRRLKLTTRVLFCLMAAADTSVLWIAVFRYWVRITFGWDIRVAYPSICPLHVFAVYVSTNLAVTIFCILCVDRCLVIYNSLEGYRIQVVGNTPDIPDRNKQNSYNREENKSKWPFQFLQCIKPRRAIYRSYSSVKKPQITQKNQHDVLGTDKQPESFMKAKTDTCVYTSVIHSNLHCTSLYDFVPGYEVRSISSPQNHAISDINNGTYTVLNLNCANGWQQTCCARLSSNYSLHSTRWLTMASVVGLCLVLIKHLVAYNYVQVDSKRGCFSLSIAEWRDYVDFATQAVLSYFIIIPADVIVYRAIKRHQQVLTALRISASRGSQHTSLFPVNIDRKIRICTSVDSVDYTVRSSKCIYNQNSVGSPINSVTNEKTCLSMGKPFSKFGTNPAAKAMVATAAHLSRSHLFIFRTLITLSILHFVINLPGYLYAQVILPSLGDRWYTTFEGHLLYDTLFLISFTNNGVSFFILLCTVQGFRQRVNSTIRRSCIYRIICHRYAQFRAESAHRSYVLKQVHRKHKFIPNMPRRKLEISRTVRSLPNSPEFVCPSVSNSLHYYTNNYPLTYQN